MISNQFKSASMNEASQMNKMYSTVSGAVLDSAAVVTAALGFSGALPEGAAGQALGHAAAGRIGGIGGNLMLATMNEKVRTQQDVSDKKFLANASDEELESAFDSMVKEGDENDRLRENALDTVWDILSREREKKKIMNTARQKIEKARGDKK